MTAFVRKHAVRIIISVVLLLVVYGALLIWMPYRRELSIATKITSVGGIVDLQYCGPNWIPQSTRHVIPFFQRIRYVNLMRAEAVPAEVTSALGSLSWLNGLGLSGNQLAGLDQLKEAVHFNSLTLSGQAVNDAGLGHVQGLSNLRILHIYNSKVTDAGLENLRELVHLQSLDLRLSPITGTGLKHLSGLQHLRMIDLSSSGITDSGLESLPEMPSLEWLRLAETQITDVGLEHLTGLTTLQFLDVKPTPTTIEGRAAFRKALPNCKLTPIP